MPDIIGSYVYTTSNVVSTMDKVFIWGLILLDVVFKVAIIVAIIILIRKYFFKTNK